MEERPRIINSRLDRFRGCLLGLAVGDALGAPVELWLPHQISAKLGCVTDYLDSTEGMNAHKLRRGEWTDDTLMALALARGIIKSAKNFPRFPYQHIPELAAAEHLADWLKNPKNTCYGKATREALQALGRGVSWRESGSKKSLGNGVAMRIAPAGLWVAEKLSQSICCENDWLTSPDWFLARQTEGCLRLFDSFVTDIGRVTHCGNQSLACAIIQAYMTYKFYLYTGKQDTTDNPWKDQIWYELLAATSFIEDRFQMEAEISAMLRTARRKGKWRPYRDIIAGIGSGFTAIQSCSIAWIMAIMHAEDFRLGVLAAVNSGGDADTVGAMTGALLGAKFGAAAIQKTGWLQGLGKQNEILETADKLFAASTEISV